MFRGVKELKLIVGEAINHIKTSGIKWSEKKNCLIQFRAYLKIDEKVYIKKTLGKIKIALNSNLWILFDIKNVIKYLNLVLHSMMF